METCSVNKTNDINKLVKYNEKLKLFCTLLCKIIPDGNKNMSNLTVRFTHKYFIPQKNNDFFKCK